MATSERSPYTVRCSGLDRDPAQFHERRAAYSYAQGIANHENVQCAIVDRYGNTEMVQRGSYAPDREYSPYRDQPFFHPNPAHPRSKKRFLRNEPQGWTPGMGPSQTQVRPQEFFEVDTEERPIVRLIAPALLFGLVLFLSRETGELADTELPTAPGASPRPGQPRLTNGKRGMLPGVRNRRAARKLYGSAVLSLQASDSMGRLAVETKNREIANISARLRAISNRLMGSAQSYDAGFVQSKVGERQGERV